MKNFEELTEEELMCNIHEYKGYRIKIERDDMYDSPDAWGDDERFLVYDHKSFDIQREGFKPKHIFDYLNDCHKQIDYDNYYIFTVYAYIHSGVFLSLAHNGDRWDTSNTGYILISKDELNDKLNSDKAKTLAEGLIEAWNQYLSGEVYGYIIEKQRDIKSEMIPKLYDSFLNNGLGISLEVIEKSLDIDLIKELQGYVPYEQIDSCWGYYGKPDGDVLTEAKDIIDNL